MKRLLLLLLAVSLVLTACGQEETATPDGHNYSEGNATSQLLSVGTVYNADVVNIRMEPDEEARILDTASRGEMFQIVDYDPASAWQKINYRGETAYISGDYLYMQEWESGTKLDIGTIIGDIQAKTKAVISQIGHLIGGFCTVQSIDSIKGQGCVFVSFGGKFNLHINLKKDAFPFHMDSCCRNQL